MNVVLMTGRIHAFGQRDSTSLQWLFEVVDTRTELGTGSVTNSGRIVPMLTKGGRQIRFLNQLAPGTPLSIRGELDLVDGNLLICTAKGGVELLTADAPDPMGVEDDG